MPSGAAESRRSSDVWLSLSLSQHSVLSVCFSLSVGSTVILASVEGTGQHN